jgi:hypothetical protein
MCTEFNWLNIGVQRRTYAGTLINKRFFYSSFNDAFSVTQIIERQLKGREVNDEMIGMWKEAVVA